MTLTFEPYDPPPRCGAWRAASGKVRCELSPHPDGEAHDPAEETHLGRDRAGRFHGWYGDARLDGEPTDG